MAWGSSAVHRSFVTDALGNAQAFDLSGAGVDTFRATLWNNTITPDKDAAEASARYNTGQWATANEQTSGADWPAAGVALASPAITNPASGVVMFDATDTASGTAATLTAYGTFVYDDTLANDPGVCYNYFGGVQTVTTGTFTIIWNANGLFRATV